MKKRGTLLFIDKEQMIRPNNIYLGDCLEVMTGIADESIDAIICDLPYGVLNRGNKDAQWDVVIPFEPLWTHYERIIKKNGAIILFGSGMFTAQLMMSNPKLWRYNLVWDKGRATGFLNANRMPLRYHEDICVFYKQLPVYHPQMEALNGREPNHSQGHATEFETNQCYGNVKRINPTYMDKKHPRSIISIPAIHCSEGQSHPTQKPVDLLRYLIRTYTNSGGGNFRQYDGERHHLCSCCNREATVYRYRERPQVFRHCQKAHQSAGKTTHI